MTTVIIIAAAVIWAVIYIKWFKKIRCGNMICITGGIKTGKSTLSVRQAIQLVGSQRRKTWLFNHVFRYILLPFYGPFTQWKIKPKKERPALYSNIPLKVDYIPITTDLLERKERPIYGSVAYICEASLVADSMTFKDPLLNEELLLFNKLWGHASKGGYLIYDTQSIQDNHYAVKRCLNSYIYIHHAVKGLFFIYMWLREERYSEDKTSVNTYAEDIETTLKLHIVPKRTWRKFDAYCYSALTDDKPVSAVRMIGKKMKDLKARKIVSFKKYMTLKEDKK